MADRPRTWFGPVVLLGLVSAALLAVVAARDWFHLGKDNAIALAVPASQLRADMPLALALALVVLGAWGVVLVTRGRVRRFVLVLGVLAAAGVVACLVVAPFTLPDQIRDGLPLDAGGAGPLAAYVVACVVAPLALAALLVGWRLAPRWPTMSSRYDAPTSPTPDADETDLWKALDAGRDPTDRGGGAGP